MNAALPRLCVIGAGHLGRALARLWHEAGVFRIADVVTRSEMTANAAVAFIGAGRPRTSAMMIAAADVYLIATPDPDIAEAARALGGLGMLNQHSIVFHCSGSLSSDVMAAAAPARLASIHPIRSFAQPEQAVAAFAGTWCGAEGERDALDSLIPAFAAIGAQVVQVDSSKKPLYHAAAVIGANYLVTLIEAALQAFDAAGIARNDALQMLAPLAEGALANALRVGPAAALSGPIARGDFATVQRHEAALQAVDPGLAEFYRLMAQRTAELARSRENL